MIKVDLTWQEELADKERSLRFDDDVMAGLKYYQKLTDLECAVVKLEVKSFGKGVHTTTCIVG